MNVIVWIIIIMVFMTGMLAYTFDSLLGMPWGIIGGLGGGVFTFAIILVLGMLKSPMWTFMTAAYAGKPLLQIKRKDNTIAWERATMYADGMVDTKNYGTYFISPKDPGLSEKKSGAKIYRVSDGLGNSISFKVQKVLNYLYRVRGWVTPQAVEEGLRSYHKCRAKIKEEDKKGNVIETPCEWEGIPRFEPVFKMKEDKPDEFFVDSDKEKVVDHHKPVCPNCEQEDLLNEYPQIINDRLETLDIDAPEEIFFPAALHPDKAQNFAYLMVRANEAQSRANFVKMAGLGAFIMFSLIGVAILFTILLGQAPPVQSVVI